MAGTLAGRLTGSAGISDARPSVQQLPLGRKICKSTHSHSRKSHTHTRRGLYLFAGGRWANFGPLALGVCWMAEMGDGAVQRVYSRKSLHAECTHERGVVGVYVYIYVFVCVSVWRAHDLHDLFDKPDGINPAGALVRLQCQLKKRPAGKIITEKK